MGNGASSCVTSPLSGMGLIVTNRFGSDGDSAHFLPGNTSLSHCGNSKRQGLLACPKKHHNFWKIFRAKRIRICSLEKSIDYSVGRYYGYIIYGHLWPEGAW